MFNSYSVSKKTQFVQKLLRLEIGNNLVELKETEIVLIVSLKTFNLSTVLPI